MKIHVAEGGHYETDGGYVENTKMKHAAHDLDKEMRELQRKEQRLLKEVEKHGHGLVRDQALDAVRSQMSSNRLELRELAARMIQRAWA